MNPALLVVLFLALNGTWAVFWVAFRHKADVGHSRATAAILLPQVVFNAWVAKAGLLSTSLLEKVVLPASVWVEVEAPAVEVDRGLEVLPVAETAGGVPDPLDLRVQAFGRRVGDPVAQVGEDVRQVRLEHPRLLDHGLEPRVGRPEVPVAEKPAGGPDVAVLPQVRGRLLERPGAGDLERAVA